MKPKIFAIICIILLLVCLVACNNRDPNGDLITTGRKPFAKPDPSNPYDQKIENQTFEDSSTLNKCFDNVLCVYFTNTESLNNIFHDYVIEDFQKFDILKIAELETYYLNDVRSIISRGTSLSEKESALISKYNRSIRIEFNFHDYNKLIDYYHLLFKRPEVRFIDPDGVGLNWFAEPNDLQYQTHQDVAELIDLEEAWDHTTGSSSVKIGVLDSGVLGSHIDLQNNLNTTISKHFGNDDPDALIDRNGHGTCVAGIIGATANNNIGVAGTCWNIDLISLKISDKTIDQYGNVKYLESPSALSSALYYSNQNDIRILCFSGGWEINYIGVQNAIELYDGLLICAAGNHGAGYNIGANMDDVGATKIYPACYTYSNILTVGASDLNDNKKNYSNYGATSVDIFAPCDNIHTTTSSGSYDNFSGTSASAPIVAGIAGLLLSYEPTLTTAEIKSAIINTAEQSSDLIGKCVSGGRVNAWKAIESFRKNYRYTNNGARSNHTCKCTICNYSYTEAHVWNSGLMGYSCHYCLAISKFVEVVIPKINKRYQLLLQQAALMSDNPDFYYVNIDEHSALVYDNGKYYLVYESDEQGLPKYQISTDFLAYGYTIVGNQIVRTSEIEIPPIYEPVVKTA